MSIIHLPRRIEPAPRRTTTPTRRDRTQSTTAPTSPRRERVVVRTPRISPVAKSAIVLGFALAAVLYGNLTSGGRQVELYNLQNQLATAQSSYAEQVGSYTNLSAPGVIASPASTLHLVEPQTLMQIPSTSLGATLPLPKFNGYAPVTPRTMR